MVRTTTLPAAPARRIHTVGTLVTAARVAALWRNRRRPPFIAFSSCPCPFCWLIGASFDQGCLDRDHSPSPALRPRIGPNRVTVKDFADRRRSTQRAKI